MGWNPFEDIYNGVSNFVEGVYDTVRGGIGDFFDMFESGAAKRQEQLAQREFQLSQTALNQQTAQDAWSRGFQEKVFDTQNELARQPISTLLADARQNGINPMAAMGQNVGSVSVSAGNSSVTSPSTPSAPNSQNMFSSLLGSVGQLITAGVASDTSKEVSKIQANTQKSIAEMQDNTRNRELDIQEQGVQNQNEYWQGLLKHNSELVKIENGKLDLEQSKRLDNLLNEARNYYEKKKMNDAERAKILNDIEAQRQSILVAKDSNNKRLIGTAISAAAVLLASIFGGPAGGVAAGAISSYILAGGKNPIGFIPNN